MNTRKILIILVGLVILLGGGAYLFRGTLFPAATTAPEPEAANPLLAPEIQAFLDGLPAPINDPLAATNSEDIVLGDATAKVTMIEYSSLSCPHCARHHKDILPKIQQAYIDQGKVKLVIRDFPLNGPAMRAAMLARCVSPLSYFGMAELLFSTQAQWLKENPLPDLLAIAKTAGIDDATFEKCQQDQATIDRILKSREMANTVFKIDSTPSFVVNGILVVGEHSFEEFSALFDRLLAE